MASQAAQHCVLVVHFECLIHVHVQCACTVCMYMYIQYMDCICTWAIHVFVL